MTDLGLIPVWLFIIALMSVLQVGMLIAMALILRRTATRATETVDRIERTDLAPLIAHLHETLDDLRDGAARLRAADDDVRRAIANTADRADRAAFALKRRLWPALGLTRGIAAAVSTFAAHGGRRAS